MPTRGGGAALGLSDGETLELGLFEGERDGLGLALLDADDDGDCDADGDFDGELEALGLVDDVGATSLNAAIATDALGLNAALPSHVASVAVADDRILWASPPP